MTTGDYENLADNDLSNLTSLAPARINASISVNGGTNLDEILDALYPVGSIYIGTMSTCPIADLGLGTWSLVSSSKVLQGADASHAVKSSVSAGLPNITGSYARSTNTGAAFMPLRSSDMSRSGAFSSIVYDTKKSATSYSTRSSSASRTYGFGFNASSSSSIYGNSNTVQPPAYVVNIWERTA